MSLSTPIGFLIFNRPDLTEQVFASIAQAKPKKLFVIADGPRFPEEVEKCEKTRAIIHKVDWDCEVLTNFSETNMGCGRREASGFDWVFSQVEEAIFLEDDTLPAPSFFHFCETLLERYRDDERVMHINGDNSLSQKRNEYSYYFSKYMHGWGWASWRRAWQHYDYYMKTWPKFRKSGLLQLVCEDPHEQKYWSNILDQMYADPQVIDTWDYQWIYTCWSQNGLAIAPNQNLISNLGFNREDAAHTTGDSPRSKLTTTDIWE
ncbi:MAG: glycosyltransferase family 2 protein, partial [Scytonema sp. PMC 1069.18]|nr:glycosyltransferase family 2 protein [Scytonema sp. PMC 1069.18]